MNTVKEKFGLIQADDDEGEMYIHSRVWFN